MWNIHGILLLAPTPQNGQTHLNNSLVVGFIITL